MVSFSPSLDFKHPLASHLDILFLCIVPLLSLSFWQRLSPLLLCEEGLCSVALSLSIRLSHAFSLSLSLWGEAVNNAGGLADLCEPEALRKAGAPGGDRQREGPDECAAWRAMPYRNPGCQEIRG